MKKILVLKIKPLSRFVAFKILHSPLPDHAILKQKIAGRKGPGKFQDKMPLSAGLKRYFKSVSVFLCAKYGLYYPIFRSHHLLLTIRLNTAFFLAVKQTVVVIKREFTKKVPISGGAFCL